MANSVDEVIDTVQKGSNSRPRSEPTREVWIVLREGGF
jgi:hypothetical protein